eukprot:CAMPEP_0117019824 /NCGR_PEP_ID=MMETSP0472-20121206/15152_1 /TAXON_ID=693140 ORGANISM="Tiarina fusus, Strain LIS" /NCGR_SAMPLE_ID=MMETSP0472 /ASSEMBLY_ACC=CAM_ASM_000603 /LENGTH=139 /DNA_ID=CAMNT_0004724875 /DNA_START=66 /DNA_END=485 /DNA_ORIENTATION=+
MTTTQAHNDYNYSFSQQRQQQPPIDSRVQSIFQEYLYEDDTVKTRLGIFTMEENEEEEEDLVLAALAVLEEDDQLTRRGPRDRHEEEQQKLLQGAALAGGIAGLMVGGPLFGLMAAGGAALTAAHNPDLLGTVRRSGKL